jgi:hypothetical protein
MVVQLLPEGTTTRTGVETYLGPGERVMYVTRRHSVVLGSAVAMWLGALMLGLIAALTSRGHGGLLLSWAGGAVVLAGTLFLGCKTWQWRAARYVVTNDRVLLIEGILARRVVGLPLRGVLDTTYRRTLTGRVLGYGDLELNLSGRPGLRKLTSLPRPDTLYYLILSLTCVRDMMYRSA